MTINWGKFLAVLRRPVFFVVFNFFLSNTILSLLPFGIGNIVYHIGRVSIIIYAGWLVTTRNIGGRWHAALAGIVIYFTDHVLIKGGFFLLNHLFKPEGMGFSAFGGVLASFFIFTPLAMIIGVTGALIARMRQTP
jgi:hypothetical protein